MSMSPLSQLDTVVDDWLLQTWEDVNLPYDVGVYFGAAMGSHSSRSGYFSNKVGVVTFFGFVDFIWFYMIL